MEYLIGTLLGVVPLWRPGFLAFDILAAAFLAMLLMRHSRFRADSSLINARRGGAPRRGGETSSTSSLQ